MNKYKPVIDIKAGITAFAVILLAIMLLGIVTDLITVCLLLCGLIGLTAVCTKMCGRKYNSREEAEKAHSTQCRTGVILLGAVVLVGLLIWGMDIIMLLLPLIVCLAIYAICNTRKISQRRHKNRHSSGKNHVLHVVL